MKCDDCVYRCVFCGASPERPISGAVTLLVCVGLTLFVAFVWWVALQLLGIPV